MPRRIVIIGGVALGPKVACRARRLDPEAQVTMIDRDSIISYGGCGIPYYVSGDVADAKELCTTVYHAVRDPEFFRHYKRVQVATETEALAIDRRAKTVRVRDLKTDAERELEYDTLVLATGSTPFVPPVPGVDLPGVYTVANLHKAVLLKDKISSGEVDAAVVIGGGAIGLEMAEALTALWGIKTTLVEMCDQVLPQALGPELARMVENHLRESEVGGGAAPPGPALPGAAPRGGPPLPPRPGAHPRPGRWARRWRAWSTPTGARAWSRAPPRPRSRPSWATPRAASPQSGPTRATSPASW